jgi:hypothetical protein
MAKNQILRTVADAPPFNGLCGAEMQCEYRKRCPLATRLGHSLWQRHRRPADENPDHPPWTLCSPRDSRHHRERQIPALAAHPHPASDPREARARAGAGTLVAPESVCGAAVHSRQASPRVKSEPGPPMTLGGAAAAGVRLIVWCRDCSRRVEPDPTEMAQRYGTGTAVLE